MVVEVVVEVVVEDAVSGSSAAGHAALQPSLVTVLAQRSERSNPKIVRYVIPTPPNVFSLDTCRVKIMHVHTYVVY